MLSNNADATSLLCVVYFVFCVLFFGDKVNETYLQAQQEKRPYVKLFILFFLIALWLINTLQLYEIDEKKFYSHYLVII